MKFDSPASTDTGRYWRLNHDLLGCVGLITYSFIRSPWRLVSHKRQTQNLAAAAGVFNPLTHEKAMVAEFNGALVGRMRFQTKRGAELAVIDWVRRKDVRSRMIRAAEALIPTAGHDEIFRGPLAALEKLGGRLSTGTWCFIKQGELPRVIGIETPEDGRFAVHHSRMVETEKHVHDVTFFTAKSALRWLVLEATDLIADGWTLATAGALGARLDLAPTERDREKIDRAVFRFKFADSHVSGKEITLSRGGWAGEYRMAIVFDGGSDFDQAAYYASGEEATRAFKALCKSTPATGWLQERA